MSHLLLVEDDSSLGETLTERLLKEGYEVDWVQSVESGHKRLLDHRYDLVILDVGLPDGTGFDLVERFKETRDVPFIFVSAMGSAEYRLKGYELGAEEFIPKPFHLKELLMRIKHVLHNHAVTPKITIGQKVLDRDQRAVISKNGAVEYLPQRDFQVLKLLLDTAPKPLSRDAILQAVWGEEKFPTNRTVDNSIVRLRQVLGDDQSKLIRTVRGVGYQFVNEKEESTHG